MTEHRKIALHVLGFLAIMVLLFALMSFAVNRVNLSDRRIALHINPTLARIGGQERLMTNEFNPISGYDVVVLGSSHAYRGYDPRVFLKHGVSMFNAGSSAQHPTVSLVMLNKMIAECPSKPTVIIDVFDKILEMEGGESSGRMLVNCANWSMANEIFLNQFDVVAINNYCARLFADHVKTELEVKDYIGLGYCSKASVLMTGPEHVKYKFEGNRKTLKELEKCLAWLKENEYHFVMVSHPMPAQKGFAEYHKPAADILHVLASNYQTVFIDFTEMPHFSTERQYFSDATHLNQIGVELFNEALLDTLDDLKVLNHAH